MAGSEDTSGSENSLGLAGGGPRISFNIISNKDTLGQAPPNAMLI